MGAKSLSVVVAKGQSAQWQLKVIALRDHMQNIFKLWWADAWLFEKISAYKFLTKGGNEG